jgi:hypothetical protein
MRGIFGDWLRRKGRKGFKNQEKLKVITVAMKNSRRELNLS